MSNLLLSAQLRGTTCTKCWRYAEQNAEQKHKPFNHKLLLSKSPAQPAVSLNTTLGRHVWLGRYFPRPEVQAKLLTGE